MPIATQARLSDFFTTMISQSFPTFMTKNGYRQVVLYNGLVQSAQKKNIYTCPSMGRPWANYLMLLCKIFSTSLRHQHLRTSYPNLKKMLRYIVIEDNWTTRPIQYYPSVCFFSAKTCTKKTEGLFRNGETSFKTGAIKFSPADPNLSYLLMI